MTHADLVSLGYTYMKCVRVPFSNKERRLYTKPASRTIVAEMNGAHMESVTSYQVGHYDAAIKHVNEGRRNA